MQTRPASGIVLVAVLAWISGILQLVVGVSMILASESDLAGWAHIIVGLVTFPVCLALFRARASARIIVSIVFLIEIPAAAFAISTIGALGAPAVTSAVLALGGLLLLYTPSANASVRTATRERRERLRATR